MDFDPTFCSLASILTVHVIMLSPPLNSIHFLIWKGAIKNYIIKKI